MEHETSVTQEQNECKRPLLCANGTRTSFTSFDVDKVANSLKIVCDTQSYAYDGMLNLTLIMKYMLKLKNQTRG